MPRPRPRFHKIKTLEVRHEGFLEGLRVELDPQLNCFIGGRGTGKTSALEFMRFALQGPPATGPAATALKELIEENLQKGQIRLTVETKDGLRYTVSRTAAGAAEVTDEQGQPVEHSLHQGALFEVDVFSAHEVEGLATDTARQLAIIDRCAGDEVRRAGQSIAELLHALEGNARAIGVLQEEALALEDGLNERQALETRLKALPAPQGEHAAQLQRELEEKGRREERRSALTQLEAMGVRQRDALAAAAGLLAGVEQRTPEALTAAQDGAPLAAAAKALLELRQRVEQALRQLLADADGALELVRHAGADQERLFAERERQLEQLLTRHEQEKGRADERVALQRQLVELEERAAKVDEKRRLLAAARAERERLMKRLGDERQRRTTARVQAARRLTEKVQPEIRIGIVPRGDPSEYTALLVGAFRGSRTQYRALVDAVVREIAPRDLARMLLEGATDALVGLLGESRERVNLLVRTLTKEPALAYRIEAVELQDLPRIELADGGVLKEVGHLSTGQRCTAVLPLLLLEDERPLIIDQPEDSIDNSYVWLSIIPRLLEVKTRRQLIFATHNANIPVLGEAKVFVLASDGRHSRVAKQGTVDECQEQVETILEGGREAYRRRGERYGEKFASD